MARRKRHEEHVNHERWLVSYADFITLLFAFFVVMYSISQVNENKYRVLSSTLTEVFNKPQFRLDALQAERAGATQPVTAAAAMVTPIELPVRVDAPGTAAGESGGEEPVAAPSHDAAAEAFHALGDRLQTQLADLVERGVVTLRGSEEWLEIELPSALLFESGEAELSNRAMLLLGRIATILRGHGYPVRVEGFTDNQPISTGRYPSNWALSAARAAAVVELFIEEGIPPFQLMAAGYGEFQPVADNGSEAGRARNRRVVLMVAKSGRLRPALQPTLPLASAADQR